MRREWGQTFPAEICLTLPIRVAPTVTSSSYGLGLGLGLGITCWIALVAGPSTHESDLNLTLAAGAKNTPVCSSSAHESYESLTRHRPRELSSTQLSLALTLSLTLTGLASPLRNRVVSPGGSNPQPSVPAHPFGGIPPQLECACRRLMVRISRCGSPLLCILWILRCGSSPLIRIL